MIDEKTTFKNWFRGYLIQHLGVLNRVYLSMVVDDLPEKTQILGILGHNGQILDPQLFSLPMGTALDIILAEMPKKMCRTFRVIKEGEDYQVEWFIPGVDD